MTSTPQQTNTLPRWAMLPASNSARTGFRRTRAWDVEPLSKQMLHVFSSVLFNGHVPSPLVWWFEVKWVKNAEEKKTETSTKNHWDKHIQMGQKKKNISQGTTKPWSVNVLATTETSPAPWQRPVKVTWGCNFGNLAGSLSNKRPVSTCSSPG